MDQKQTADLSRRLSIALLILLMAAGCVRITRSYKILNNTFDESAHLACGLEWLASGSYNLENMHPPIARAFLAAGPFLRGVRPPAGDDMWDLGVRELYDSNEYWQNLTATLLGNLPFF